MSDIAKVIRKIVDVKDTVRMFDAEVISVDQTNRVCTVTMIGGESSNTITVRLMAGVDDGAYFIPKVGSTVIVTMSDYVQPYVSMYSEVESIIWLGGEYQGVPIATHPTDSSKGLISRINAIEEKLNHFISTYDGHTHKVIVAGVVAGPATVSTTALIVSGGDIESDLSPTTVLEDIIHPNITH